MTEAEALDEAARAAGWRDWENAVSKTRELSSIRAHAKTIMENAALKAEVERLKTENDLMRESLRQLGAFGVPFTRDIARTALERLDHGDR